MFKFDSLEDFQKFVSVNDMRLPITELFFSIEGEGIRIGEPTIYLRVLGCPHKCSFCDTLYSCGTNRAALANRAVPLLDIIHDINQLIAEKGIESSVNIEFTGGSPDWYPNEIGLLASYYKKFYGAHITMQISGGIWILDKDSEFANGCYDKIRLFDSADLFEMADLNAVDIKAPAENIPMVIPKHFFRRQDELKLLINDEASYEWCKATIREYLDAGVESKFVITTVTINQDEGVIEKHLSELKDWTERILSDASFPKENIKILPRLHVLLWRCKKGV